VASWLNFSSPFGVPSDTLMVACVTSCTISRNGIGVEAPTPGCVNSMFEPELIYVLEVKSIPSHAESSGQVPYQP
jgi:hypothetical protein